jgi:flavodoxin
MSALIIYATRHGCTEKAVKILAENLDGDVSTINLKKK